MGIWRGKETIAPSLLEAHYNEVAALTDQFKLDPDWEKYDQYDRDGKFGFIRAHRTSDGEMVGYLAFICEPHLHYRGTVVAIGDVHYVMPEWRRRGVASQMIEVAERWAKTKWNAKFFVLRHKVDHPHGDLYTQMGYKPIDTVYLKEL